MKLLIDGVLFSDFEQSFGMKRIWQKLIPALAKEFELVFITYKNPLLAFTNLPGKNISCNRKAENFRYGEREYTLQIVKDERPDFFLSTLFTHVPKTLCPSILLVYDLINEELYPKGTQVIKDKRKCFNSTTHFITISESTKSDLAAYLHIDSNAIVGNPLAADDIFYPSTAQEIRVIRNKFQLDKDYFLVIGYSMPHKNTKRMLEAFQEFSALYPCNLLHVAPSAKRIKRSGNVVVSPRNLSTTELRSLYSGATGLIFASLKEGFGLPILEAQKCGCPVITSNCSSMLEIAENSAVLVNPLNTHSIVQGMLKVYYSKLIYRERGFVNIKRYSWDTFNDIFINAIRTWGNG